MRVAHEDLDLGTRGGRLAADIQAVIAADYIRNLREEIKKGINGRLEQGIFPFAAPIGYRNNGGGVAKTPDPVLAPLVVYAFERYATGEVTLRTLAGELKHRGWPRSGSANGLAYILHNEFYAGVCFIRGKRHSGIHQPLVSPELFARAQRVFRGTRCPRAVHHFRYRMRLRCSCTRMLTGEQHKGHIYYRCHRCPGVSAREEDIDYFLGASQALVIAGQHIAIHIEDRAR